MQARHNIYLLFDKYYQASIIEIVPERSIGDTLQS